MAYLGGIIQVMKTSDIDLELKPQTDLTINLNNGACFSINIPVVLQNSVTCFGHWLALGLPYRTIAFQDMDWKKKHKKTRIQHFPSARI